MPEVMLYRLRPELTDPAHLRDWDSVPLWAILTHATLRFLVAVPAAIGARAGLELVFSWAAVRPARL